MIAMFCAVLVAGIDLDIQISMSMTATAHQTKTETTVKCGKTSCDCGCFDGEVCRCAATGTRYWVKTPSGQYGLFQGSTQVGIWNGEGYWAIEDGKWGAKQSKTPIPLPQQSVVTAPVQPRTAPAYQIQAQPAYLPTGAYQQYTPQQYFPQQYAVPQAPTCVGGRCFR